VHPQTEKERDLYCAESLSRNKREKKRRDPAEKRYSDGSPRDKIERGLCKSRAKIKLI
jgi:hypothetical protein